VTTLARVSQLIQPALQMISASQQRPLGPMKSSDAAPLRFEGYRLNEVKPHRIETVISSVIIEHFDRIIKLCDLFPKRHGLLFEARWANRFPRVHPT
jgi:hypothetical protein